MNNIKYTPSEALVVATKETGLEVNADKYLGTTLTNQNSIQEEIKSRLKLGNACYHSVRDSVFAGVKRQTQ